MGTHAERRAMFEETAREILGNGSLTMCPQDVERLADVLEGNVDMSTMATIDSLTVQRDAAEALAREATAREDALGLQVVAQAARLRLATAVCDALRRAEARAAEGRDGFADYYDATAALAAWDAVPGDQGGEG